MTGDFCEQREHREELLRHRDGGPYVHPPGIIKTRYFRGKINSGENILNLHLGALSSGTCPVCFKPVRAEVVKKLVIFN